MQPAKRSGSLPVSISSVVATHCLGACGLGVTVTEETVGFVEPEGRIAGMGHGGAEDTLFLAECKRVFLRIDYE
jgi:hypothetical protein